MSKIDGIDFNDKYAGIKFIILTNIFDQFGFNTIDDIQKNNGIITFCKLIHMGHHIYGIDQDFFINSDINSISGFDIMYYYHLVVIPNDSIVEIINKDNHELFKSNKLIISDKIPIWENKQLVNILVNINGNLLKFVNNKIKSYDICLNAVKNNGMALRYADEEFITKEICDEAYRKYKWIIKQEKNVTDLLCTFYKIY